MNTQEILTIIAMAALGLCLVLAFSKGLTKNLKTKESLTHVCSFLVVIAVALLAVTQFLSEQENMDWEIGSVATSSMPNGGARTKGGKKVSMGVGDSGGYAPRPCCTTACDTATNKCPSGYAATCQIDSMSGQPICPSGSGECRQIDSDGTCD